MSDREMQTTLIRTGDVRPGMRLVISGETEPPRVIPNRASPNGLERRLRVEGASFAWIESMPDWPIEIVVDA